MKITFVTPAPSLNGGFRAVTAYADRLRQRGHEVHIVARPEAQLPFRAKLRSWLRGRGWPERAKPNTSYLDRVGVPFTLIDGHRPVDDADIPDSDVVIATWWETAEWVARFSHSKGAKVYFLQDHEVFPYLPVERAAATWRLPMHKIVVAKWLADVALNEYGDADVSHVFCGVDHQQFWAPPRGKNRVPTIGFMYTSAPRKSCHVAIEAFRIASERFPELRLVTFGSHREVPELRLPPHTEFHVRPDQDKLRELYAKCDAWLFSSTTEGFGLPILEAMACRTPVIGTPAGAAPEILPSGGGILVAPEDPVDMARAIMRMITFGESEWVRMSDLAHQTASRYTWDRAAELFEAALQTAIAKQESGTPRPSPSYLGENH